MSIGNKYHDAFREANDPTTEKKRLFDLSKSDDPIIRSSVAINLSTNIKTLLGLIGDCDLNVVNNLKQNQGLSKHIDNYNVTNNVILTLVTKEDAEFILSLRENQYLNKFISSTSSNLDKQMKWIVNYKNRENCYTEFYFILRDKKNTPFGTVRLYDFKNGSFCWGSWIVYNNAPIYFGIESAISIYELAFNILNFSKSHFDVRRGNEKVIKFHKRMGAQIINSDELNIYFEYSKSNYIKIKNKYGKYFHNK